MTIEEAAGEGVEVWPDNVEPINVFLSLASQWRIGYSGATGIDYAAIPFVFDVMGVAPERRRAVFEDLRVMEQTALEIMRAKR